MGVGASVPIVHGTLLVRNGQSHRLAVSFGPLDSGREAVEDRRASDREEKPMDDVAILRRVEHTIQQCRDFNMEFDARTIAEIMADEDTVAGNYEPLSAERAFAFVEYEKAADRALHQLRPDSQLAGLEDGR
jgi:hypothetical protein